MSAKFYNWTKDNVFFLTRSGNVEITSYGFPKLEDGSLYYYSCQSWYGGRSIPDEFGRNKIDRLFAQLCDVLFVHFMCQEHLFQSLTCKKKGEQYIVYLRSTDESLEMELAEMIALLEQRFQQK